MMSYVSQLAKQGVFSYHSKDQWCHNLKSGRRSRIWRVRGCMRERTNYWRGCSFSLLFHKKYKETAKMVKRKMRRFLQRVVVDSI